MQEVSGLGNAARASWPSGLEPMAFLVEAVLFCLSGVLAALDLSHFHLIDVHQMAAQFLADLSRKRHSELAHHLHKPLTWIAVRPLNLAQEF